MKYLIPLLLAFVSIPAADAQMEKPSGNLERRVSRLEGVVEQIDKRLTNIEQDQREMLKRLETMRSELRGDMDTMRSELSNEMSTTFRWLVGIIIALFWGNVGVNWYWNRKNTSTEAPSSVPRSTESRPARSLVVDQP